MLQIELPSLTEAFLSFDLRLDKVKLDYLDVIPHSLREFLAHETISFVSYGKRRVLENENYSIYVDGVSKFGDLECKGMVDLGHLAAKVLKAPYLIKGTITKYATVNGIKLEKSTTNWNAWEFSEKELNVAVDNVRKT
ncbi:hypothetical protein SLEP1_g10258 [Rubroshorea leprosula]|uniref:Uncharacterized protein n=1 Tax=Rubroshorea leprosula TaxID=152421 RepID=A0AAV5IC12_9ROSI|nr:hypothetical protein SLEP1_g10258 [Rubroshorea leprosula]